MNINLEPVQPVLPIAPYLGGKRNLAKRIIKIIENTPHETYAEPFVGMGGIFFRRDKKPKSEFINDKSRDVSNLFRILQRHYTAFMDMLKYQLTSRADFNRLRITPPENLTDLERAARFLYLQKLAFGGRYFGGGFTANAGRSSRFNVSTLEPLINDVTERLYSVNIECLSYEDFINKYDSETTLFFIDPPYWGYEDDYGKDMFSKQDFDLLRTLLEGIKGRFIMTINDLPETRKMFGGFHFSSEQVHYSCNQKKDNNRQELIITNFEVT